LRGYFDSIPHDRLMARVEAKVSDGRVLDLIRSWLKADILQGLETWTPTKGSPQGAVISPLLANIYLDPGQPSSPGADTAWRATPMISRSCAGRATRRKPPSKTCTPG
jgi:hypothetical protein